MRAMDRPQEKRIIYICLLGMAAIFPIAINPSEGPYISLAAIFFVLLYIRSDRKKVEDRRGFPVITKADPANAETVPSDKNSD
jgi:hypothetical protein